MAESVSIQHALEILQKDALKIKQLLRNQKNHLCIAECKAFEEVVDTQMYGFSREVAYAIKLGILTDQEGQALLSELERELNQVYAEIYEERKEKEE